MVSFEQKKAIGPIISITLLLLVSIVSMVFLSSWYSSFQSDYNSKVTVPKDEVEVKGLVNNFLYVRSYVPNNISYKAIRVAGIDCSNSGTLIGNDYNKINISNCTKLVSNGVQVIMIISDVGVFKKNLIVDNTYLGCSLNGTTLAHGQSFNFYNSSFVSSGSCQSVNRLCSDGVLSGDPSFNISSCYVQDFISNPFYFTNQTGIALNFLTSSNTLTPDGYTEPLAVNVTGAGSPQLSVNSGAFTSSSTMVPTDTLQLRLTSSNSYSIDSIVNISLGGFSSLWKVTTTSQDTMPNPFYFTNQSGVALNTLTLSNTLTPNGYTGTLAVNVSGAGSPQLSVNGGAFTSSSTISLGDTLQLRLTSSGSGLTDSIVNISLGGFSSLWKVTTTSGILICPPNYVRVNGSNYGFLGFANYDFCVMETEATCNEQADGSLCANNNYLPVVNKSNTPWSKITQPNTILFCSNLGTRYHLMTLNESMVINRIIENDSTNWANGVKYSTIASGGGIYLGNVGSNDQVSCNTGAYISVNSGGAGCLSGSRNKRALNLSGKLIWDWTGNVWEWLPETCDQATWAYPGSNIEWTDPTLADVERPTAGPKIGYDSTYGFGMYKKGCASTGNPLLRGGTKYGGTIGGLYATRGYTGGSGSYVDRGFRCIYS